ncbi:MAG TPA: histidine phosphatase family protein [Candidatus Limnocylindrales bacterium]|nr:histidine phosphatase family protein [Candidatus Limnocylindrales bacterium]
MTRIEMAGVAAALALALTLCSPSARVWAAVMNANAAPGDTTEPLPDATPGSDAGAAPTRITPGIPNAAAASIPTGADSTLVANLKKGGYILFFRHALTNWEERDTPETDFSDRSHQRNLSAAGKTEAAEIGRAIAALKIPIERVLASPMWRTRDTAQLAFGAYDTTGSLFWKGRSFRDTRIKMLSTPPAAGKNLVLVGHQDQLIPIVPGLRRDQLKEGDALVFQPLGGGKYRIVTQVAPADWARLARTPFTKLPAPPVPGSMPAATPESGAGTKETPTNN